MRVVVNGCRGTCRYSSYNLFYICRIKFTCKKVALCLVYGSLVGTIESLVGQVLNTMLQLVLHECTSTVMLFKEVKDTFLEHYFSF